MPANYIKNFESYREKIAAEMGVDENLIRQSQVNLADFMKRLLVRRFESSISAFRETLDSMIISSEVVLDWYERLGKVPVYKNGKLPDLDSLEEAIGDELDDKLKDVALENELQNHIENGLWLIDKKELKKAFVDDVTKDIDLLKDIYERWFGAGFPRDPKLEHFAEIIRARLHAEPHRKVVVFTEFADTAHYLFEQMKGKLRAFKYSAADATKVNRKTIKENFDAGSRIQKNDYDVLIATDAISEGFNLHRAGIVFNYDIPYNPTRVIQRVGRINRINKKIFDELFIYNFFPTATGERETRVKQISTLKIAMVHALFGEDTKVLTKDEELNSWFTKQFRESLEAQEEASPEAKYEDLIRKLRASQPEIVEQALAIPRRCRIRRSEKKKATGVIVFAKKGAEYAFKLGARANSPVALTPADALGLFEAEFSEDAQQTSEAFEAVYSEVKQNLFSKKTQVALDRGKRDAILKVEALIQKLPHKRDYLDDLLYILRELDALPDRYARFIRTISVSDLNEDVERLQKECPHSYLVGIIERERQIEEGEELLILSEELI
jgi:superfamily II DNA/RNA helicase